jgi:hypothetical protein
VKPLGLPFEHRVGHPLECLADHGEPAGAVARAEMQIAEPAAPPPASRFDGQHDQIEGV